MFKIVCLGDSITCNLNSPSYVDYWQELLDQKYGTGEAKVISAGVNGETAQDGYYRLNQDVLSHKPDLVTIMFGHNDVYLNVGAKAYQRYLDNTLNVLQQHHLKYIWLMSPNHIGNTHFETDYHPYLEVLAPLAQEKQITYIDLWAHAFTNQDLSQIYTHQFDYAGLTGVDYIHPNATGHRLLAQYLMDELNKLIKI